MNAGNLLTMSDAQLKAWAASLSPAKRQAALSALIAPVPDSLNNQTASKAAGPQAVKDAKQTRPLNSFIAYRSYYSPIFTKHMQKDISGLMKTLWKSDPYQGKWSVMAKAYSLIRDKQGKAKTPLGQFLAVNAPKLAMVTPESYLTQLGWRVSMQAGVVALHRATVMSVDRVDSGNAVSVNDLIYHSQEHGLVSCAIEDVIQAPQMSFATLMNAPQAERIVTTPSTQTNGNFLQPAFDPFLAIEPFMMATSKEDIEAELAAWNVAPMTEQEGYAAFIPGQPVSSFDPAGDNPFVLNDLSAASYDEASFNQHQP